MYYIVKYSGPFGFIKPWTAVRDGETYSQQFLTPSIVEGLRQKLEVTNICRHRLSYAGSSLQQEVVKAKAYTYLKKQKLYQKESSILRRGVMLNPVLWLAFDNETDAQKAFTQHVCLCRNEDVLLPDAEIYPMNPETFSTIPGFELHFEKNDKSFCVGYNRFNNNEEMFGWLEIVV
jgi:hypothetical protein